MSKTLREMSANETAVIERIEGNGELSRRIRDMGIIPGREILVMGRAPLYDPVAVKIKETVLTLRNNEADHIIIKEAE